MRHFPKIELHRHLEGTFSVPTLHKIAMKNKLPFSPDIGEFRRQVQFPKESEPDFLKFLSLFKNDWYRSLGDVEAITYHSVKEMAADGIFYIELRFSPEHFAFHNNFRREEVTRLVIKAAGAAAKEEGFFIRFLITFNRNKQEQHEMSGLYRIIRSLEIPEIVGIDLAGDETNFPPHLFIEFFDLVNQEGVLRSTVHAGEVTPSTQIWDAVRLLQANRIGHGVSAVHDEELQHYLRDNNIVLEQCITSNYQTGSWTDESTHPLGVLHRNGVPVTINSDDPFIQDTDLTDDYLKTVRYFGFSIDDLVAANVRAIHASFLKDNEKTNLEKRYLAVVAKFRATHGV